MTKAQRTKFVERIDQHIIKHANKYSAGSSMSFKAFRRLANFVQPGLNKLDPKDTQSAVQYVNAQAKINRVLVNKGLKLKSKNYYNTWYIEGDVKAETKRMQAKLNRISSSIVNLRAGAKVHNGNASAKLSSSQHADIASYINARPF